MNDPSRPILSVMVVGGCIGLVYLLITGGVKTDNQVLIALIGGVIGQIVSMAKDVISFNFASSKEAVEQGKTIATIAKSGTGNGSGTTSTTTTVDNPPVSVSTTKTVPNEEVKT